METIKLGSTDAVSTDLPIPPEGQRPDGEVPLKIGFDNMSLKVQLAKLPDPANIEIGAGSGLAAIGATNIVKLDDLKENPISWLNTGSNKYKFKLCATLTGLINKNLETVLQDHNCIIFNDDMTAVQYGGFLVLTIGAAGSGADVILNGTHVVENYFRATVIRTSEEF